jgi:hypothetical protein
MANYIPANLKTAQAKLLGKFQSSELRFRQPATFLEFVRQSPIMFPNYVELRTREDRTVETNYRARTSRSLGTGGRTFNHTGTKGDSAILTPSWTSYDDTFNMSLKQADNSIYSAQEEFQNEIENAIANFAEGLETAAVDYIFNNRSQVNGDTTEGTFDGTDFVYEIDEATKGGRSVQITKSVMDNLAYRQGLVVFCDTIAFNKFEELAAQGAQNSTNYSFQFNGVRFVKSLGLGSLFGGLVSAYSKGAWIVCEEGSLASLPWIPKQNREGVQTKEQEFASVLNPVDGLNYAFHSYSDRADDSSNNGSAQDEVTQYEISIDIALNHAPLTNANETVLQAFALV